MSVTTSSPNVSLDRLLRQVRSLLRTHRLPRPTHLFLSTRSRSASLAFATGTPAARLEAVLLWSLHLEGITISWGHQIAGELTVSASGRTSSGITVQAGTTAGVAEVGGRLRNRTVAEVAGTFRLAVGTTDTLTCEELARVVTAARTATGRALEGAAA
ncbi:hypothetical protein M8C13_18045 [Crossiella sp. SN42]|uniref:hypothetical protein n=1 Tax=Crossiella sp. SN42 TaxID=2944808 RepID=UPI00207C3654|nr:hypothetical protein [Crossiella sp. SN42]MCO1577661.1 hypothetical protein [Crossiella sp. SN42]